MPVLLGHGQRLHDLLVGVVVRGEAIDVLQVAAVRVVGQQVAAEDEAADLELADLGLGQRGRRGGRRGGWFGLLLPARIQGQREAGGGEEGFLDEGATIHFRLHTQLLSVSAEPAVPRPEQRLPELDAPDQPFL